MALAGSDWSNERVLASATHSLLTLKLTCTRKQLRLHMGRERDALLVAIGLGAGVMLLVGMLAGLALLGWWIIRWCVINAALNPHPARAGRAQSIVK